MFQIKMHGGSQSNLWDRVIDFDQRHFQMVVLGAMFSPQDIDNLAKLIPRIVTSVLVQISSKLKEIEIAIK